MENVGGVTSEGNAEHILHLRRMRLINTFCFRPIQHGRLVNKIAESFLKIF